MKLHHWTILCFVSLAHFALSQHPGVGECPNPSVQLDFQVTKYLGVWYEISRYFAIFELDSKCDFAHYTHLPDGHIKVVNSGENSAGKRKVAVGEAYAPDPSQPAKLSVRFGNSSFMQGTNYWVLSTDYTSYSMVFTCHQFTSAFHVEFAWILSRTPTISEDLKDKLLARFESLGISAKPFHFTEQGAAGKCTYPQ